MLVFYVGDDFGVGVGFVFRFFLIFVGFGFGCWVRSVELWGLDLRVVEFFVGCWGGGFR